MLNFLHFSEAIFKCQKDHCVPKCKKWVKRYRKLDTHTCYIKIRGGKYGRI